MRKPKNLQLNRLTVGNIKRAKFAEKGEKYRTLYDGGGLILIITNRTKRFYYQYWIKGKGYKLPLGVFPAMSLQEARKEALRAKLRVLEGFNPQQERKIQIAENRAISEATFEAIAVEWFNYTKPQWSNFKHSQQVINTLKQYVFPIIGDYPISNTPTIEIFKAIKSIKNKPETAGRVKGRIRAIFDYAIQTGRATNNPASNLPKIIRSPEQRIKPHLALQQEQIGEFLCKCDQFQNRTTALMLRLLILTFTRSSEIRGGLWAEIKGNEWHIPAERMKMKRPHIVPLSNWALETLAELKVLANNSTYFCVGKYKQQPITDSTLSHAMHKMGYKGVATPHGFRAMASTILNESGLFNPDAIERQLAHADTNTVRGAYNRADYLEERHRMMQWYSDYIKKQYLIAKGEL